MDTTVLCIGIMVDVALKKFKLIQAALARGASHQDVCPFT